MSKTFVSLPILRKDFLFAEKRRRNDPVYPFHDDIFNSALIVLEDLCFAQNGKTLNELRLPSPVRPVYVDPLDLDLVRERNYDRQATQDFLDRNEAKLNAGQREIYDRIIALATLGQGGSVFIDASGGTGKKFLLEVALAKLRLADKIVLAVASSGIAATMLTGGRTAHKMFHIPLELEQDQKNAALVKKNSSVGKMLRHADVIL